MKKIDIAIVADFFPPDNKAVAIRMVHLANALREHDFDVTVYTSKKSKQTRGYNIRTNVLTPASNKDPVYWRLLKELLFSFETFVRLLFSNHDYYIVTSPPFTMAVFATLALVLRRKKYVIDIRDEYPEVYFEEGLMAPNGLLAVFLRKCEQMMYKNSMLITTVTGRIKEKIESKTKGIVDVWLVRNGYADGFLPVNLKVDKPFRIVFHGNLGKFQHPTLIADVARMCLDERLDVQFDIYGWGANAHQLKD
ncbi:MAG TPA: glycosyltransferase, partial [Chryseosolibacter sp.]|nr:glycosyltransferase [Chryseosolibacter sp.]